MKPIEATRADYPMGKCSVCGSDQWWWREPSKYGGKGGWCCGTCHPKPKSGVYPTNGKAVE